MSRGVFVVVAYLVMLAFVLNYRPGDQYVFYLATYIFISTAIGVGIGRTLEWASRFLAKRKNWTRQLYPLLVVLCALVVVAAYAGPRREALKADKGVFVQETYPSIPATICKNHARFTRCGCFCYLRRPTS